MNEDEERKLEDQMEKGLFGARTPAFDQFNTVWINWSTNRSGKNYTAKQKDFESTWEILIERKFKRRCEGMLESECFVLSHAETKET